MNLNSLTKMLDIFKRKALPEHAPVAEPEPEPEPHLPVFSRGQREVGTVRFLPVFSRGRVGTPAQTFAGAASSATSHGICRVLKVEIHPKTYRLIGAEILHPVTAEVYDDYNTAWGTK